MDLATDLHEALVARRVSEPVVVLVEPVDVDHQDADRRGLAKRAPPLATEELLEGAVVRQRGAGVQARQTVTGLMRFCELGGALLECARQTADPGVEAPVPQPEGDHAAQRYGEGDQVHLGSRHRGRILAYKLTPLPSMRVGVPTPQTVGFSLLQREIRPLKGGGQGGVVCHGPWLHPVEL